MSHGDYACTLRYIQAHCNLPRRTSVRREDSIFRHMHEDECRFTESMQTTNKCGPRLSKQRHVLRETGEANDVLVK